MKVYTCIFGGNTTRAWFGADAPKTCDNEVLYVILIIDFRHVYPCAAVAYSG